MQIELTKMEFRRLLDLVYIGNWILNSTRGEDRFRDYDAVESKLFALCREHKMDALVQKWNGESVPSKAYAEGGIHEAIMDYEDAIFFDILGNNTGNRISFPINKLNDISFVGRSGDVFGGASHFIATAAQNQCQQGK